MGEPWLLGLDLGTGGLKTAAVSLRGELLGRATGSVQTRHLPGGGAVQDPDEWWALVRAGVGEALAGGGAAPADLAGVGITGQWGSTVPVGADGCAVGPCLTWADSRGGPLSAAVLGGPLAVLGYAPGNLVQWLRYTGGAPSPHGADPLGHELHLRHREPEVYRRTAALLEPLDYLGLRLTGRRAATPASMILSWLTDNRPGARARYVPDLVRRSTRDPARLPDLLPTGSRLGPVLPAVAAELGLPDAVPVVAGVADLHTGLLGSGAAEPFQAHLALSTTAWISCEVPFKRTDVLHQVASVPGLRPGTYVVANSNATAGACLRWLRESVLGARDGLAGDAPPPDYEALNALAASAPAGADGVLFTPWLDGERSPVEDHSLRAAFLNVSLGTDRARLVRALMEGVAYNARWLLEVVERFVRRPLPVLRVLGGGARSDLWCQVHADVLGRRIERVADPMYANARGAALFTAVSLGLLPLAGAAAAVPVAGAFEPDPAARAVYEPLYREFARLYGRLRGTYARLNAGR